MIEATCPTLAELIAAEEKALAEFRTLRSQIDIEDRRLNRISNEAGKEVEAVIAKARALIGLLQIELMERRTKARRAESATLADLNAKSHVLRQNHQAANLAVVTKRAETYAPPKEGVFICWKKCYTFENMSGYGRCLGYLVKLEVPAEAARCMNPQGGNKKCRASEATVLEIVDYRNYSAILPTKVHSKHNRTFVYEVGATVKPTAKFNPNPKDICTTGIHFYMQRFAAENH